VFFFDSKYVVNTCFVAAYVASVVPFSASYMTLNDIVTHGRTLEMADAQATEMERESVNKITNTNRTNPKTNICKFAGLG
jgi:cobyric acid synthase